MDSLKDLIIELDNNLDNLAAIRTKNLQFQTDAKQAMAKLTQAMEHQKQVANEQDRTIRNQNQIILKVFRTLQSKDRDELFCSDTDGQPLRCCMDCGQKITAVQYKLLHNGTGVSDASEVLSKTMKKQRIQEKNDDIQGNKAEDINEPEDDNTIDDNGENSRQDETSQTSNKQSLSDSMDSQGSGSEFDFDVKDCIDVDVAEDDLLRESPIMDKIRPTPKPRKRRNNSFSLIPKRDLDGNSGTNQVTKSQSGPWNHGNRVAIPKQFKSHDSLQSRRVITDIKDGDGITGGMKIKLETDVVKTNSMKSMEPTILDCYGSNLPAILEGNGIPAQPYVVSIYHSARTNQNIRLINFQFLETNKKITQELKKCNLPQMSLFTSDFSNSEFHVKHGVVKSLFHCPTHTLGFLEVTQNVLCCFKSENRTNNIMVDVNNKYNTRILVVFPRGPKLIRYNDEITDIVLITDGVATREGREYIKDIELATYEEGSNVVVASHYDVSDKNVTKVCRSKRINK